jgi:hypothetical protein
MYEELCARPEATVRELFDFVGLDWHNQTASFIDRSTQEDAGDDFFAVFRSSAAVVDRWRQTMSAADQEAVRQVVRRSTLAQLWPDLHE